ncbi:MAG: DNA polymerase III subunit [Psychromonas sp.]
MNKLEAVPTPWLNPVIEQLIETYQSGRFAHGLLFTGCVGIGKFKLAEQIAKYLLCSNKQLNHGACDHCHSCSLFNAGNHLDLHLIQNEGSKSIGIEHVRSLINVLNERPNLGENKVVIINNANLLTTAAANALLKTLEEPQGNSYLILLTPAHHQLMPTMLSRVQHRHLHAPNDSELLAWLSDLGFSLADKGMLRLFENSPLMLLEHLQSIQGSSQEDERKHCVEGLFSLLNNPQTLFNFGQFLAEKAAARLSLLFYLLHDLHKLKLSGQVVATDAVYQFASPQLQAWQQQISLKGLRDLSNEVLKTQTLLMEHSGLKKELLINALLIKIKNEFN